MNNFIYPFHITNLLSSKKNVCQFYESSFQIQVNYFLFNFYFENFLL